MLLTISNTDRITSLSHRKRMTLKSGKNPRVELVNASNAVPPKLCTTSQFNIAAGLAVSAGGRPSVITRCGLIKSRRALQGVEKASRGVKLDIEKPAKRINLYFVYVVSIITLAFTF